MLIVLCSTVTFSQITSRGSGADVVTIYLFVPVRLHWRATKSDDKQMKVTGMVRKNILRLAAISSDLKQ